MRQPKVKEAFPSNPYAGWRGYDPHAAPADIVAAFTAEQGYPPAEIVYPSEFWFSATRRQLRDAPFTVGTTEVNWAQDAVIAYGGPRRKESGGTDIHSNTNG